MAPPLCLMPHVVLKDCHHHLTKYEGKETKISIFTLFSEFGKIWKCNLGFSKIPITHLFYELETKFWIYGWMEKLCLTFSFTVENKLENSHKKGWPYFKLNIDDWDIPFLKILRLYLWIGKKFLIGENEMNPLGILPVHWIFGQKVLNIFISSLCR